MGERPTGAAALDRALDQRRSEVRKRWNAVARDAGMTPQHLSRIRRGEVPLTEFAGRGLDNAVAWPAGTAMSYYHTGAPLAHAADRPRVGSEAWWENLRRILPEKDYAEVRELAERIQQPTPKPSAQSSDPDRARDIRTESSG